MRHCIAVLRTLCAVAASSGSAQATLQGTSRLHLVEYVSDSVTFNVVSTLIVGPTEVMLVDAQMGMKDGRRVAEMIAATGKRLTGIFITHPDEDHTFGAQAVLARFPNTPLYMTPAAVEDFKRHSADFMRGVREYLKADAPDSIVPPRAMPSNHFTVDGVEVTIVPDLQGDVLAKTNSFLYIPSLGTVIAGDLVFAGVHPFLAHSTESTRGEWLKALERIAALRPRVVVPGHKPNARYPDSPDALSFMAAYLKDFDAMKRAAANADDLAKALQAKYSGLGMPALLMMSSRSAFRPKPVP